MMNRNERMEKLNVVGVDTGKYFNLNLPEGLKPGATISLMISENGQPVIVGGNNDIIRNQIIEDGYVRNTKLFRRFVMAHMFYMLNYTSWNGREKGYTACLNNYGYDYSFKMMLDELKVLSKLEAKDTESFEERSHFFTKEVVVEVMNDYIEKLKNYVEKLPNRNCKGVPYKKIKGINIFNEDLHKKIYAPLISIVYNMKAARSYAEMYAILNRFMNSMVHLPYNTTKSKAWVDAYKGAGAYYTLKNMVMFHDCGIKVGKYDVKFGADAVAILNAKLDEYKGAGWRMFAFMNKVIKDNNFDFNKRMAELGK